MCLAKHQRTQADNKEKTNNRIYTASQNGL